MKGFSAILRPNLAMTSFVSSSLVVRNLALSRGHRLLFRDISFQLDAGHALILEGANGVGKTSLLRVLAGFLRPSAGVVRIGNVDDSEERGKLIGWWGHSDGIKAQLTTFENLAFWAKLHGAQDDIDLVLDGIGLARVRDLATGYLSAGQKRRLALARLKLCLRPVWLLDEPMSALDAEGRSLAASIMAGHCATGGIIVAATHQPIGIDGASLTLGAS